MYGFRHQNFHAGSFYVKSALRKSRGDQTELLAVGSAALAVSESSRQKHMATNKEGLGPLYGFRHQDFHAGSFYVKSALASAAPDTV